jgi:hypothetical protein
MSTEATKLTGPTDNETLIGGIQVEIAFRGASPTAPPETVFVRQVNVEEYPDYLRWQDDETAMVELFCGKPVGWAKTLTRKSHDEIVCNGERVNGDFFQQWVQRRQTRMERLSPGSIDRFMERALTPLPRSPLKSPPTAG